MAKNDVDYSNCINISQEVQDAIKNNRPVVALESTIISHGMPYPQNVETALNVEKIIREKNVVPATIAIIKGAPTIGINESQIDYLGKEGLKVTKVSRRDIPIIMSQKLNGATTVAATMILAKIAKIKIFATGGIGGVHRNAQTTMDISADLEELQQTDVNVVCAGAKSILDLGLTMEYLETKGVAVIGYQTDVLPAFYTSKSEFKVNYRMDNPSDIAAAIKCKDNLHYKGGMLIVNPIPKQYDMNADYINKNIMLAIDECNEKGIKGKDVTPFLLDKIQKLTQGKSLKANIELVYNNARLAADIAVELSKL
ncbi:MAG: pseudouridine-5'-phosphate glycosidase [Clostridia bacterium]